MSYILYFFTISKLPFLIGQCGLEGIVIKLLPALCINLVAILPWLTCSVQHHNHFCRKPSFNCCSVTSVFHYVFQSWLGSLPAVADTAGSQASLAAVLPVYSTVYSVVGWGSLAAVADIVSTTQ